MYLLQCKDKNFVTAYEDTMHKILERYKGWDLFTVSEASDSTKSPNCIPT